MTGFEASKVLTPGAHHLKFTFGNDTGYAHNSAGFEVVISDDLDNPAFDYNPSPNVVFIDANTGFAFFINDTSGNGGLTYKKTTNGGANWGKPITLDNSMNICSACTY